MSIITLIFLSIIQGLTEFLPISSSGHLAFWAHILKFSENQRLSFTAFLHLGTSLALIIFFAKKIEKMLKLAIQKQDLEKQKKSISLIIAIIIGTIPIAVIGLTTQNFIDRIFQNPIYALIFMVITGFILFLTKFATPRAVKITYSNALIVGIAQAVALLPGISRSGITISTALFLGLSREDSFEFSFLLSIPAVIGANILVLKDVTTSLSIISLVIATIISCLSGLIALYILRRIVSNKKFHNFAYYCWIFGGLALILMLVIK